MAKYDVVNIEKKNVGQVELSDTVFGSEVKVPLIHEAVVAAMANKRLGTASTKTRGDVKGTRAKPYRQKGTGRARHGSYVSPLFVGGGITFGPKPRSYNLKMTKKKKRAALRAALSSKVAENKLLIIDKWVEKNKTKEMTVVLKALDIKSALIVLDKPLEWLERSTSNIPYIDVTYARTLNTYNVMAHDYLVCTKEVVTAIQEGLEK